MGKKFVEIDENLSDEEIVELINAGNLEPIGILINRYYPVIVMNVNQLCPAELHEDVIQEATFALYSAVKGYNRQKSSFSTFAGVCIKRSVISSLKSHNRKRNVPSQLVDSIDDLEIADGNSPEKIFFDRNDYETLADSIKLELSALEYKVLQLYVSGYRYSVIADKLNITERSVSNTLSRIRKKLKP